MPNETQRDSLDLHVLGTELSERILEAQRRFASIGKKCEHYVIDKLDGCVPKDQVGAHRQGVGFKKDGKTWKLYFVHEGVFEREPNQLEEMLAGSPFSPRRRTVRQYYLEWEELSQASLVEKSKAVRMLPRLFEDMQAEYMRRAQLVSEALKELDTLDDQLPVVKEGE